VTVVALVAEPVTAMPRAAGAARRRRWWPYGLVVVLLAALGGCGISATDTPVDEGDPVSSGDVSLGTEAPPTEDKATTPADQVTNFLKVAAGGLASATERVKRYLTQEAREAWQDPPNPENPPLTVIRLLGTPITGAVIGDTTPVTVKYQVVGTMTGGLGRIEDLADPSERQMRFDIVGDASGSLRISRIDYLGSPPQGLLLSDAALSEYYLTRPIYFWDSGYATLVPDVRYVPRTVTPDKRSTLLLEGLLGGPSSWLSGGVQRLPAGTAKAGDVVTGTDGTLMVRLSAQETTPDALRRLKIQLQWTLAGDTGQRVELFVDDQPVTFDGVDYRQYNRSYVGEAVAYDVADNKVVGISITPPVLSAVENANVVAAAIGDKSALAAFVRTDGPNRRYLQFVRAGRQGHVDAQFGRIATLGRPSFVPGTDVVLVPTGANGHLLAVSAADGSYANALHSVDGVTAVAVSPDGRRVAFVADGQVYVSYLIVGNNSVTVGSSPRPILPGQADVSAVTWTSESELKVGGATAIWRVTADGGFAENQSGKLNGLRILDLVCNPEWRAQGQVGVYATTQQGVYSFRNTFVPTQLHAPFFGY